MLGNISALRLLEAVMEARQKDAISVLTVHEWHSRPANKKGYLNLTRRYCICKAVIVICGWFVLFYKWNGIEGGDGWEDSTYSRLEPWGQAKGQSVVMEVVSSRTWTSPLMTPLCSPTAPRPSPDCRATSFGCVHRLDPSLLVLAPFLKVTDTCRGAAW